MTKALVTTPIIFNEIARYSSSTIDKETVESFLDPCGPEVVNLLCPTLRQLTITSLLMHCSGLPAWRNFWIRDDGWSAFELVETAEEKDFRLIKKLNRAALEMGEPGTECYSDLGFLLLGFCLKKRKKKTLSEVFRDFCQNDLIFPLTGNDIGFSHSIENIERYAVPTAYCALRKKLLVGEVHDENAASFSGESGHAGLFASGKAISMYLRALFNSKIGHRLLEKNRSEIKNPLEKKGNILFGWQQNTYESSRAFLNGLAMGHLGFTGTAFWISSAGTPTKYAILLTNRVITERIPQQITPFRKQVFSLLNAILSSSVQNP